MAYARSVGKSEEALVDFCRDSRRAGIEVLVALVGRQLFDEAGGIAFY